MSERRSFQPTELTYSQLKQAGARNDRMHHQEIILLTWTATLWNVNRCRSTVALWWPQKKQLAPWNFYAREKYGIIFLYLWKQQQKSVFIYFHALKTDFIFCHIFTLSVSLSLITDGERRIHSWVRYTARTGTLYSSKSFHLSIVSWKSVFFLQQFNLKNKSLLNVPIILTVLDTVVLAQ